MIYGFGKYKGKPFANHKDGAYRDWILNGDFPDYVKEIVEKATEGLFPVKLNDKGDWEYKLVS